MFKKWIYLSSQIQESHCQKLSDFLNTKKCENQFKLLPSTEETFEQDIKQAFEEYDYIRIGPEFLSQVKEKLSHLYVDVANLNVIDALRKDKSVWWPKSYINKAFVRFLTQNCNDAGVTFPALVIGANGVSRSISVGLVNSGYTNILITDLDEVKALQQIEELKKIYFNIDFEFVPKDKLTLLSGIHSFVVNTVPVTDHKDLFYELYYCNYLKKGAVVLDLNLYPIETPLLRLSKGIGSKVFSGHQFWAYHDLEWAKNEFDILSNKEVNTADYINELFKIYSGIPFDESLILGPQF